MRRVFSRTPRRHPVLHAIAGVLGVLACVALGWGAVAGIVVLAAPRAQPAAPRRSIPSGPRRTATIRAPSVPAAHGSVGHRRLLHATETALDDLIGARDVTPVSWDPSTGLWDYVPLAEEDAGGVDPVPTWWQSALALDAVVRAATVLRSHDPIYQQILRTTYADNVEKPGTTAPHDFENKFMDDTAWWAIAWVHAARYELRVVHDVPQANSFLTLAETDARYLAAQPARCGASAIPFRDGYTPNTITDAEYIDLTAQLARLRAAPGPLADPALATEWTRAAKRTLRWLESSGLLDMRTGGVHRTDNPFCRPVGRAQTYTEGEVADALVQMRLLTHDPVYTAQAAVFIDHVLKPAYGMIAHGVLQEPCEAQRGRCRGVTYNITVFKGLFTDAVADWAAATHSRAEDPFLAAQARAVLADATGVRHGGCLTAPRCQLSMFWARRIAPARQPLVADPGSQTSGLSALVDALRAHGWRPQVGGPVRSARSTRGRTARGASS